MAAILEMIIFFWWIVFIFFPYENIQLRIILTFIYLFSIWKCCSQDQWVIKWSLMIAIIPSWNSHVCGLQVDSSFPRFPLTYWHIFNATHWSWVMHICISMITIIGSDNGLSLGQRQQAIIWTNAGILLIGPLGTNFGEILIEIHSFSFNKMHKMSTGKWRTFCLGLSVLTYWGLKEMTAILLTTIWHVFYWQKMFKFLFKFHWSLLPKA